MTLQHWLRQQVTRLEKEIRNSDVFEGKRPASQEELLDLRRKAAIHTFLDQELRRREQNARRRDLAGDLRAARAAHRRVDTQEVPLPACVN
ncbi:MAG: hypothetical protein ACYC7A_19170 [Thermoanaerobaculia bacterium]